MRFQAGKCTNMRFRPGFASYPAAKSLHHCPDPFSGLLRRSLVLNKREEEPTYEEMEEEEKGGGERTDLVHAPVKTH